ncbi:MAG: hypothetical protein QHH26_11535 [Armatimonadota bacterium]|nr:hypothetical protein [Armatimonadota bacterium]
MNCNRGLPEARKSVGMLLVVTTVLLLGINSILFAQGIVDSSTGPRITLDVIDADLSKVVMLLARDSKQSIIIADQEKATAKVTATLKDMPLETALKRIVESVGCTYRREADGTYIIGGPASATVQATSQTSTPSLNESLGSAAWETALPQRRNVKVEKIPLYYVRPVDMMWLLGLYQHPPEEPKSEEKIVPGVHIPGGKTFPPVDATPPLTESLRADLDYAGRAPGVSLEAAQGVPPSPPGRPTYTRPGQTQTQPGQAPGQTTTTQQTGLWPEGVDFIMPYELDNSLIVKGTDEGIEELESTIRQLDLPPKQVSIKAEFVEISTTEASSLGIDWSLERANSSFQTQFGPGGNVIFGYANGNVMATLRTKLLQNKAKIINAPIISTLNNVPATIQVGRQVPYWTTIITSPGQGQLVTQQVPLFLSISSQLLVRPTINRGDNSITVWIQPVVADQGDPVKGPDGTEIPITNQQSLSTTRRVANGETIVIGGIIRKSDSTNVTKIPLLGDIPIIGPLFRNVTKNNTDVELLIFLTPSIVPERPVASTEIGVAQPERRSVTP